MRMVLIEITDGVHINEPDSRNDTITDNNAFGAVIPRQLGISRSNRISRTFLLRQDHDPSDPARYADRWLIRNFFTVTDYFISNIIIFTTRELRFLGYVLSCIYSLYLLRYCTTNVRILFYYVFYYEQHSMRAPHWSWRSRIDTHKWPCRAFRYEIMIWCCQSGIFHATAIA